MPRRRSLPKEWNLCYVVPHGLQELGSGIFAMHCPTDFGAVGSAAPAMHCHTAWGQWVVQLLQCSATPPGGAGQWKSCNARAHQLGGRGVLPRRLSLPKERSSYNVPLHCMGAVGSATLAMHYLTARGQWAVELLSCTATRLKRSWQLNSCKALPHHLGAVGGATPATHCLTT